MCPNRMADGRAFTEYRPRCAVNAVLFNLVSNANMVQSSYDARMYLQANAEQLMQNEKNKAIQTIAPCAPCTRSFNDPGTMLPSRYVVRCDGISCSRTETNPFGVGDGRQYS